MVFCSVLASWGSSVCVCLCVSSCVYCVCVCVCLHVCIALLMVGVLFFLALNLGGGGRRTGGLTLFHFFFGYC